MKITGALLLGSFYLVTGCGDSGDSGGGGGDGSGPGAGPGGPSSGPGMVDPLHWKPFEGRSPSAVAEQLGLGPNFLVGMGNDLADDHNQDGAYTLATKLDLHYNYMVGLPGEGGWPDWNAEGSFVNVMTDTAAAHDIVPFFTMYSMAAHGDGNLAGLSDDGYMGPYWNQAKLLFERLALFDKPAMVHLEPDFWAYAEQQAANDPTSVAVRISGLIPECAGLPDNLVGLGRCWVTLARNIAPKVLIGFHASQWADGDAANIAKFLNAVGADGSDVIFADMLDRDAGCFEAAVDPNCMRGGTFYWDESNTTSPNFHEYLDWSKKISDGTGRPIVWWQIPFGVPSDTPGGSAGHYRDNRVHYIFSHIQEFVDAGGLAAAFGAGAGNQTGPGTDDGQFEDAIAGYYASPVALK